MLPLPRPAGVTCTRCLLLGANTSLLLQQKRHPEQNYRRVLALLSNAKKYGNERLNNACGRALLINSPTRSSIESILKQGLDKVVIETDAITQEELALDTHENVRGADYYH